jgi:hypothetical protein
MLANHLLPKWSGEPGDTEKFAQEVTNRIGGEQGDILYFRIADTVICGCKDDPQLSWERIKKGFEASEKQYGTSMLTLNRLVSWAAYFNDPIFAGELLSRIGEQWDEETWKTKERFEWMKQWAKSTAPSAVERRTLEGAAEYYMHTPGGPLYKESVEKTYRGFAQECVRTRGTPKQSWDGKFEVLINIGPSGTLEDQRVYSEGPVVSCLYDKLQAVRQGKVVLFPQPQMAPYWVRMDLNRAEFAPLAAK